MRIFERVHCKAYLKKISDGVFLRCTEQAESDFGSFGKRVVDNPVTGWYWNADRNIHVVAMQNVYENGEWKTKQLKDLSDFEGNGVNKTYRKRAEEEFNGFLVGITQIVATGFIGTDYSEEHVDCHCHDYKHLFKERHYEKVGVVYFKNNCKRYVLLDDMEIFE